MDAPEDLSGLGGGDGTGSPAGELPGLSKHDEPATPHRPASPGYRTHLLPRSRDGWVAVVLFLGILALAEPPIVHAWANRVEPWFFGVPFLYGYLLVVYVALIGVLLWVLRRKI